MMPPMLNPCDLPTKNITALFFDIGGVLIRTEDLAPRQRWERKYGLADWQLQDLFFNSAVGLAAQVGQASTEDAWAHVAHVLGVNSDDLTEMRADFFRGDALDRDLIAFIRSLRPRYKTGVISNAMPDARGTLADRINAETFDEIVFSGEEGVKKPVPDIYLLALRRLGVAAEQSIFVDDMAANVEAARVLGMHAIQFVPGIDLRAEFARLGVTRGRV